MGKIRNGHGTAMKRPKTVNINPSRTLHNGMGTQVPSVGDGKDAATNSAGPGVAGGVGILVGSALFGPALGPAAGGIAGGATQSSSDDKKNVATTGIMLSFNNMAVGMSGGGGGSSSGVK